MIRLKDQQYQSIQLNLQNPILVTTEKDPCGLRHDNTLRYEWADVTPVHHPRTPSFSGICGQMKHYELLE